MIAFLKANSKYYPDILYHRDEGLGEPILYISTLVRICRGGIWYVVHHVDKMPLERIALSSESILLDRLIKEVYFTQHFFKIAANMKSYDGSVFVAQYFDALQISEEERLKQTYNI